MFYLTNQMLYFKDLLGPMQTNFKIQEKLISLVAKRGGWFKKCHNTFSWPTVTRGYIFSFHITSRVCFSRNILFFHSFKVGSIAQNLQKKYIFAAAAKIIL